MLCFSWYTEIENAGLNRELTFLLVLFVLVLLFMVESKHFFFRCNFGGCFCGIVNCNEFCFDPDSGEKQLEIITSSFVLLHCVFELF